MEHERWNCNRYVYASANEKSAFYSTLFTGPGRLSFFAYCFLIYEYGRDAFIIAVAMPNIAPSAQSM